MKELGVNRMVFSVLVGVVAAVAMSAPALAAPDVVLQPDAKGCSGVLPSNDGNTDMRVVGGTMTPGGTAIFEISYPVNAASVGKEFTILDCAFINDVPALKYIISFVPSNQSFVLQMTLAVPSDAPVGGLYCNYVKTTGSPTAAQASQRKAGPACFVIRAPTSAPATSTPGAPADAGPTPVPATSTPGAPTVTGPRSTTGAPGTKAPAQPPIFLPDTALALPGGDWWHIGPAGDGPR
jgi:hypothetical protein